MNKCKKCSKEFQPSKGLINYCSMSCRNSRSRPESVRRKISEGVKKSEYLQSEEWLQNLTAANRREEWGRGEKLRKAAFSRLFERLFESALKFDTTFMNHLGEEELSRPPCYIRS